MSKKYLIYVDILGFEELAGKIAEEKNMEGRDVRNKFIYVLKERIEVAESKGRIIGKHYGESDDWLLITDSLDNVFGTIWDVLDHYTGYKDYKRIPLEIGVGIGEFDKGAKLDGEDLVTQNKTIKFLKTPILDYYRKWYRNNEGKRIKSTFIIFTEGVYQELEPLDKKMCMRIKYGEMEEYIEFFAPDVNEVLRRGKILDFLERIGYPESGVYGRIDEVYVPPIEYEDIKETLREERITFITGTQEYGKTYTAVRLMWEYYNKGYEPKWIKGGEERERITVRRKLVDIEAELKSAHIIYFEDPFGKTRYEKREDLERKVGTITHLIKRISDVYVIITSREEVFKEFKKERLSISDIKKFEKSLNLKKPSYNYEKRKEILMKWAEHEGCKWLKEKNLKNSLLSTIEDIRILPTPLSIREFAITTADVDTEVKLKEKIIEKSEETARAFSREIKSMFDDKIAFLLLLFISGRLEIDSFRDTYEELTEELHLESAWKFDRIINWFKDDKISVGVYIEFSHPSYSEALRYLLVENGDISRISEEIFGKMLFKLFEKKRFAGDAAETVAENFDKLPCNVRNLLFELSEKDETAGDVAWSVAHNFNNLPNSVRNLLFKLSEKEEAAKDVAYAVAENFDKLPDDVRNELLLKLAGKGRAAKNVAWAIAENFETLSEHVRNNLLLKLSEKDETAGDVAWSVAHNFNNLPDSVRNLLFKLSEKEETAGDVVWAAIENFNRLPHDVRSNLLRKISGEVRNKLLLKLSEKDTVAGAVADAVAEILDILPENRRSELLLKLSEKNESVKSIARILGKDFDSFSENVRNELLLKLCKKDEVTGSVLWIVRENSEKIPEDVRDRLLLKLHWKYAKARMGEYVDLLFKLSEKEEAARDVAYAVAENFDKITEDVRNELLFKLSEKDKAAGAVVLAINRNFDAFPEDVRNELLFKLSEKDKAAGYVVLAVRENFDKISERIRNELLLKLSETDEASRYVALAVAENFDKITEDVRNELLFKLSEKDRKNKKEIERGSTK